MGIKGLTKHVAPFLRTFNLLQYSDKTFATTGKPTTVVVDSSNINFVLLSASNNNITKIEALVERIARNSKRYHLDLVIVFDGIAPEFKRQESISRCTQDINTTKTLFSAPCPSSRLPAFFAHAVFRAFRYLFNKHFRCVQAPSEADEEMIRVARQSNALGVVSDDSDMLLTDIPNVFPSSSFIHALLSSSPRFILYNTAEIFDAFAVPYDFLPFLSIIAGNDFSKKRLAGELSKLLLPSTSNTIPNILRFLRTTPLSPQELLDHITSSLSPTSLPSFKKAFFLTTRLFYDYPPLPVPKWFLKKPLSAAFHYTAGDVSVGVFQNCLVDYTLPSYLETTRPLRQRMLHVFAPNTIVNEYYHDNLHSISTPRPLSPVPIAHPRSVQGWLSSLNFPSTFIAFFEAHKKVHNELLFLAIVAQYLVLYDPDFPDLSDFVAAWAFNIMNPPPKRTRPISDVRVALHCFNVFHGVSRVFFDVLIDLCGWDAEFILFFLRPTLGAVCQTFCFRKALEDAYATLFRSPLMVDLFRTVFP